MFNIQQYIPNEETIKEFYWFKFPSYAPCGDLNDKIGDELLFLLKTGNVKHLENTLDILQKGVSSELHGVSMIWVQRLDLLFIIRLFLGKDGLQKLLKTLQNLSDKEYIKYNLYNEQVSGLLECLDYDFKKDIIKPENYKPYRIFGGMTLYLPDGVNSSFVRNIN
jgi:hypothetical protein